VRPIDDFSEFGHNGSSATNDQITLGGVDEVCSLMKAWTEAASEDGRVKVTLSSGEALEGTLAKGFRNKGQRRPVGRALDLKRAYKQVPIAPSMERLCIVALWHPTLKAARFYVLRALPFGARNAVFAFGLVANMLAEVLAFHLSLAMSQYVDDFPQIEPEGSIESGTAAEELLALLGWEIKAVDGGIPRFSSSFTALGVVFDMTSADQEELRVKDKPGRKEKISKLIGEIVEDSTPKKELLTSLRGLVGYTRAQCFGRCGAAALHVLGRMLATTEHRLTTEEREALEFWPRYLATAVPRTIATNSSEPPVVIFTDGADDDDVVGIGAVLLHGPKKYALGGRVSARQVKAWKEEGGKEKLIHQPELLPALVALRVWGREVAKKQLLIFVDNDGARGALIKGSSGSLPSAKIVHKFWARVGELGCFPWVDRVHTASNPADDPSRGRWDELRRLGFRRTPVADLGKLPSER